MATIITDQAPSAKPINVVKRLTNVFQDLITVDDYDIPVVGLGGQRRIAPGVAEVTSPLIISNISSEAATVTLRIVRDTVNFVIANGIIVEPNDIVYIPLNGQFLLSQTNDKLQAIASANDRINVTVSFTQGQAEEDDPFGNV